ncbi:hypothetical protein AUP42_04165 [Thalassospira lucentensis]|uniref:Uncharacterized protein n=1 Tax=Thalassospira lucentensis TaxID=168935 RepID=A0A154L2C5_9PROT|nr:hypothetical protein [Thalassospira lucentensis]KZB62160.1 hypothetical protein AUP42_04165 [Thalassospira lucentensis]
MTIEQNLTRSEAGQGAEDNLLRPADVAGGVTEVLEDLAGGGVLDVGALPEGEVDVDEAITAIDPASIPETPEGYEITVDDVLGAVDPAVNARLHEAGFSGAQAQLVYDLAAEVIGPLVGEVEVAGKRAADRAALAAEFGGVENWKRLAPRIEKWGRENLPEAAFEVLCQTADGVRSIHRLMSGGTEPGLSAGRPSDATGDLRHDIRAKMNDPRYWRDRDPAMVAEVQAGFDRLHGIS